ncbi:MAG: M16 family metallopeptidase [Gemmatimonadales bacterium]
MTRHLLVTLGLLLSAGTAAQAQGFDRSVPPRLAPPPAFTTPRVQTSTLANGVRLYVVEMHEVPLVQFVALFGAGGLSEGSRHGLASFTANMLDEGAGSRDAAAIAAEAAYLGASLGTGADWTSMQASLKVPRRTMEPALDLLADVIRRPTFAAGEVLRQRDLLLARIIQQRDQPNVMAQLAFGAIVYPEGHPYHVSLNGDSASVATFDSVSVRRFYEDALTPAGMSIVVVGDITPAEARKALEARFGGSWGTRGGMLKPVTSAPAAFGGPRTVFLVDKPGAAQSIIYIGSPGVDRRSPDYYAIQVMNTLLGGSFSSRLNSNLRETRGYTYGARSGFAFRPTLPGPFLATAAVRTNVTDSSLIEFFKEINRIRDEPVDSVELARAKAYLALGLPGDFETTSQVAFRMADLLDFDLPFTYYNDYVQRVMAVTAADVQRVARLYVRPDQVGVVVVGDVASIRPGIEALGLGPISLRDLEGNER